MATNSTAPIRRINPPGLGTAPGYSQVWTFALVA
jgi:hypothetical protein